MDGVLVVHASTGRVLFSQAYTPNFGLALPEQNRGDGSPRPQAPDAQMSAMLLANFLCALLTQVLSLVTDAEHDKKTTAAKGEEEKQQQPTGAEAAVTNSAAVSPQEAELQALMRDPLRSFDTGAGGPVLFFRRHADSGVFVALFLKRTLIEGGGGTTATASDDLAAATANSSSFFDEEASDTSACALAMEGAGEWLAAALLRSFVEAHKQQFQERPQRLASTKPFRPWLRQMEALYCTGFTTHVLRRFAATLAQTLRLQQQQQQQQQTSQARAASGTRSGTAPWAYVVHSEQLVAAAEDEQRRKRAEAEADAAAAAAKSQGIAAQKPPVDLFRRRSSGGSVADAAGIVAHPPAFVPRPPSYPSPAATAAAAAASSAAHPSAGVPVLPAPSYSDAVYSSRPLRVSSNARFPFVPAGPRRWWHVFTRRGDALSAEESLAHLVQSRVGHTTHLAELDSLATADAASSFEGMLLPLEDEGASVLANSEAEDAMRDVLPAASSSSSAAFPAAAARSLTFHQAAAATSAALRVPSPLALQKLALLLHHAAAVLASPAAGLDDSLRSMEMQLKLPMPLPPPSGPHASGAGVSNSAMPSSASAASGKISHDNSASSTVRLWVFRVRDMLLCFPTAAAAAGGAASSSSSPLLTLQTLEAALRPLLLCLSTHFACVALLHERAERALKKAIDKQQAQKKASQR